MNVILMIVIFFVLKMGEAAHFIRKPARLGTLSGRLAASNRNRSSIAKLAIWPRIEIYYIY
jgi:hypothetical protein